MAALVGIVAIAGCSSGTQAVSEPEKPAPQIVYEGDHPEAARYKAHAACLAAAFEHGDAGDQTTCHMQFKEFK